MWKIVFEYSDMISAIAFNASSDSGLMVDLLVSNNTVLEYSFNSEIASAVGSGQPLLAVVPGVSGHSSSLSNTPSLSRSSKGQPLFSFGPASLGHSSSGSAIPSPSVSGHPFIAAVPATVGHLS